MMDVMHTFDMATPGVFNATYLLEVTDVQDPDKLGRVHIQQLKL